MPYSAASSPSSSSSAPISATRSKWGDAAIQLRSLCSHACSHLAHTFLAQFRIALDSPNPANLPPDSSRLSVWFPLFPPRLPQVISFDEGAKEPVRGGFGRFMDIPPEPPVDADQVEEWNRVRGNKSLVFLRAHRPHLEKYWRALPLAVLGGVNPTECSILEPSRDRVYLVMCWLHRALVARRMAGGISQDAPIVSRIYQVCMLGYENALKIVNTPFPFPFAQCVALLLHINALIIPLLMADWLADPYLASAITFLSVFSFYLLNEVAREIEEPFRFDPNDLPVVYLHHKFNERLVTAFSRSVFPADGLFTHIDEKEMAWLLAKHRPVTVVKVADEKVGAKDCVIDVLCGDKLGEKARAEADAVFSGVVAFILIFRTNLSYALESSKWGDAAIQVISFDEGAEESVPGGIRFRSEFVHTMSLMHALAMQRLRGDSYLSNLTYGRFMHIPPEPPVDADQVEEWNHSCGPSICFPLCPSPSLPLYCCCTGRFMDIPPEPPVDADQVEEWNRVRGNKSLVFLRAHRPHLEKYWRALPLAVLGGVNPTECSILEPSRDRVYLVMCWLHHALVARRMAGGISQDAPIVSRIYQVLSDGMLGYENALKIVNTPFPFPFAQCVALLLHINALVIPLLMADWLADPFLASAITLLSVFSFYLLNEVAREIEEPFRFDPNDLPVVYLHHKFNERLVTAFSRSVFPADGLFTHIDEKEMEWLLAKHRPLTVKKGLEEKLGVSAKDCVVDVLCGAKPGEKVRAEADMEGGSKWGDAAIQVISFDEGGQEEPVEPGGIRFRSEFVHTMSLMHALALQRLRGDSHLTNLTYGRFMDIPSEPPVDADQVEEWKRVRGNKSSIFLRAHRPHLEKYWRALPLAVLGGVNPTECSILEPSRDRVYLVMCWLHRALVARRMAGGISQDAPIVSRIYQVLSDGMLGYENALKIVNTPFPFPFAQCVALLLHINALIIPLLMADWLADPYLASAITLLSVFSFYLLNEVAREIEEPVYPADGLFTQIDEREMEWLLAKHQLVMVTTVVEGEEGVAVLCADEPRDKVRAEAGSGGG
ncbi:unnamed protein product [Closterium sp. NIES-64]|nr:unnamed protein product [Closterium sp. NIES-64]